MNVQEGGEAETVRVTAIDDDDHTIMYDASSGDEAVATVTNVENVISVTPVGAGTTTITVTASDEIEKVTTTFMVNVGDPPEPREIKLSSKTAGDAVQVTVRATAGSTISSATDITI